MTLTHITAMLAAAAALTCAAYPQLLLAQDRPMTIKVRGQSFVASGYIDGRTPERLSKALRDNPNIESLILFYVPGSSNDEANLAASGLIRQAGLTTIVPTDGLVASGGTDMFLAGTQRIVEKDACVGVHSWAAGNRTGVDFARNAPEHQLYLDYYRTIGISSDFYWYTLEAAGADDMHWMSVRELREFGISTSPLEHSQQPQSQRHDRCNGR